MRIRNVRTGDAAAIALIYEHYVKNTAISFEYTPPSAEELTERIRATTGMYPYLILEEDDGTVMGYCYAGSFRNRRSYRFDAELSIYLREDARRRGYGSALLTTMEKCLKAMHILKLYSLITLPNGARSQWVTKASVLFHEKHGFILEGRLSKSGYKFGEWFDLVFMEKDLTPLPDAPEEPIPFTETELYRDLG